MKTGLFTTKDKTKQLVKSTALLPRKQVLVGIPSEKAARQKDDGHGISQDINNAEIGYIQNFGAPEANIPAREFMYSGIKSVQQKINSYFKQAGQAVLINGNPDKALHAAGLVAVNGIRNKIQTGPFEPLKPATLAARRRRGRKGDKPLIDTGQLRNAITYVIRDKLVVK